MTIAFLRRVLPRVLPLALLRRAGLAVMLLLLVTSCVAPSIAAERIERSLSVGGLSRRYVVWVPDGARLGGPLPVVLAFPGGGQRIEGLEANAQLHAAPRAAQFLVAYLEGYERTFNVGGYCCGAAARYNVDDLGFVRAVLADLQRVAPIDRRRVYATGFSNGGQFTYYLACHMADAISAIASVSGAMQPPFDACRPSRPVPIMHWAGLADRFDPFQGGQSAIRSAPVQPPVQQGIDQWRRLDGTRATTQVDVAGPGAQCSESWSQAGAAVVVLCLVPGLGHQWPGLNQEPGSARVMAALGPFGPRLDVNDVIFDFFSHFSQP